MIQAEIDSVINRLSSRQLRQLANLEAERRDLYAARLDRAVERAEARAEGFLLGALDYVAESDDDVVQLMQRAHERYFGE